MALTLVTIGSDGIRDYVKLPDGRVFTLGSVSILKLVAELAENANSARVALNTFLKSGESTLKIDLSRLDKLIARPRSRWANNLDYLNECLSTIEQQVTKLEGGRLSCEVGNLSVENLIESVRDLGRVATKVSSGVEATVQRTLGIIESTLNVVGQLEAEGKPVNAPLVRLGMHRVASLLFEVVSNGSSIEEISILEKEAQEIQSYFV